MTSMPAFCAAAAAAAIPPVVGDAA
jgi:hypothetical protein